MSNENSTPKVIVVVKEGIFMQTLNAGCVMVLMIPVAVIALLLSMKACGG